MKNVGLCTNFSLFPKDEPYGKGNIKRLEEYLKENEFSQNSESQSTWERQIKHDDGVYTMQVILTENGSLRDTPPGKRNIIPVIWFASIKNPPTREGEKPEDRAYHQLIAKKHLNDAFLIGKPSYSYVVL